MPLLKEFRDFALRGNVLDLAVGVIIGAAFGKIVNSLVNDLLMPPLGFLLHGVNFRDLAIVLQRDADGAPTAVIGYGAFIQNVFEFLLVSLAIFLLIKTVNRFHKKRAEQVGQQVPATPSEEVLLLRDIRDALQKKS